MATSKKKPTRKSVKKVQDAPAAPDREEPRKEVAAPPEVEPRKVAPKRAPTYTVELIEGASLTRKGITFEAGRVVPVDEPTYRLFEHNGRFRCFEREGGGR
jgi:hypothetical protein